MINRLGELMSLDQVLLGEEYVIQGVTEPANNPGWSDRLQELGFIPGERVQVLVRGFPGADPLKVRIGDSTFALRKVEAACITVTKFGNSNE